MESGMETQSGVPTKMPGLYPSFVGTKLFVNTLINPASLAMIYQPAGRDKWEAEIEESTTFMQTRKWTGTKNFTLEKLVALHGNEHVAYKQPSNMLLDASESDDAPLQEVTTNILDDDGPNGKRGDFEAAMPCSLPKDPVIRKKKRKSTRETQALYRRKFRMSPEWHEWLTSS